MGGPGDYDLEEGTGADRFVFNTGGGSDRVTDFQDGLDRIQIGIGAELFTDVTVAGAGSGTVITLSDVTITSAGTISRG